MDSQQGGSNSPRIQPKEKRWGYAIVEEDIPQIHEDFPGRSCDEHEANKEPNVEDHKDGEQAKNLQKGSDHPFSCPKKNFSSSLTSVGTWQR